VGWRERDWARWTSDERRRYVGARSASAAPAARPLRVRPRKRSLTATRLHPLHLAALVVAGVVALGQLPRSHPLVPTLRFTIPGWQREAPPRGPTYDLTQPSLHQLRVPRSARVGSVLDFHGSLPSGTAGQVVLEGTYGGPWHVLALDSTSGGDYTTRFIVPRRGLLHLRLVYPDGTRWVGSVRAR
jgi:hypothetical protein